MRRIQTACILVLLGALASACGSGPDPVDGPAPAGEEGQPPDSIEIRVINLNYADARLWLVVRRGMRHPLGTVVGKGEGTFKLPWRFPAPASIQIDLIGGGRCTSDQLVLDPGDWVDFRIPVAFQEGSACRWEAPR